LGNQQVLRGQVEEYSQEDSALVHGQQSQKISQGTEHIQVLLVVMAVESHHPDLINVWYSVDIWPGHRDQHRFRNMGNGRKE